MDRSQPRQPGSPSYPGGVPHHEGALLLPTVSVSELDTMPQEGAFIERQFIIQASPWPGYPAAPLTPSRDRESPMSQSNVKVSGCGTPDGGVTVTSTSPDLVQLGVSPAIQSPVLHVE